MEELRVHKIAMLSWCHVKAKDALNNKFKVEDNAMLIEGRRFHKAYGYDNELEYNLNLGRYLLRGTPDKVNPRSIEEFKVYHGRYPLNYLLSYAHTQANLYALLTNKPYYRVVIYHAIDGTINVFKAKANKFRAYRDISLAIALKEGLLQPIPTDKTWKCYSCSNSNCKRAKKLSKRVKK